MKKPFIGLMLLGLCGCSLGTPEGKVSVKVVDESGVNIEGAQIEVFFESELNKDTIRRGISSSNDLFSAEAPIINPYVTVQVTKDGYYKSAWTYMFTSRDRTLNRYEPWDETKTLVLRKIINPVEGKEVNRKKGKLREFPAYDQEIGFDLLEGDWVSPYGKGKTTDFNFLVSKDLETKIKFYTAEFPRKGDGIQPYYFTSPVWESRFDWPHQAPLDGYKAILKKKHIWGGDKNRLPDFEDFPDYDTLIKKPLNYIFRIRTEYDDEGNIKSAYYGRINGDIINMRSSKTEELHYWINTDPTSRSLESIDLVEAEKRARSR